jgi:hypothetical protein
MAFHLYRSLVERRSQNTSYSQSRNAGKYNIHRITRAVCRSHRKHFGIGERWTRSSHTCAASSFNRQRISGLMGSFILAPAVLKSLHTVACKCALIRGNIGTIFSVMQLRLARAIPKTTVFLIRVKRNYIFTLRYIMTSRFHNDSRFASVPR